MNLDQRRKARGKTKSSIPTWVGVWQLQIG
jgi:hypothetical protein